MSGSGGNRRIVLAKRPVGWVDETCFAVEPCAEPACGPEDVLLEAVYLSTDPYLRGRMNAGPSYAPGFVMGQAIVSRVVARVMVSNNARFAVGEFVWGFLDWAQRSVAPRGEGLHPIDPALGRISLAVSAQGACRAWGRARAGVSCGARLGAGEACGPATQRAGNDGWRRKSPRPFGLSLNRG